MYVCITVIIIQTNKRGDSRFCCNSDKAKYWKRKKNGEGTNLKFIPATASDMPTSLKGDQQELEPILNLVAAIDTPLSVENSGEQQTESPQVEEIPLPSKYISQTIKENNVEYVKWDEQLI